MVKPVNETIGVNKIGGNTTNYNGTELGDFTGELGDLIGGQVAGSLELSGLFALGVMGFWLYQSEASLDVSASVMIPTVFFLAERGFLPYGQGIIYGSLIAVGGIFIFGVLKYTSR